MTEQNVFCLNIAVQYIILSYKLHNFHWTLIYPN